MAFSFGAATTPASSSSGGGGGFAVGSTPNTPAPSFAFGASNPSTTFGSNPAPSTAFGSAPSASTAFGSTTAPSTAFGSTPAPSTAFGTPAPAFGTAPAPSTAFGPGSTSLFGNTPAPAFGSAPAPAGGFGSGGMFGNMNSAPAPFGVPSFSQPQQVVPQIKGTTPYADLSPQYKAVIDKIYSNMMEHKRTLLLVQSSGPAVLQIPTNNKMSVNGTPLESPKSHVQLQIDQLLKQLHLLQQDISQTTAYALKQKESAENETTSAYTYAKWPLEATAVRRGISLSTTSATTNEEKKDADNSNPTSSQREDETISFRLGELLDQATMYVDRIERMPSPYFWQSLDDFQRRILELQDQLTLARHQIERSRTRSSGSAAIHVAVIVEEQHREIWSLGDRLARFSKSVNEIRRKYQLSEVPGQNVLEKAKIEEIDRQQRLNEQIQRAYIQSSQTPTPAATSSATAPVPPTSNFGFSSAPAPSTSSFGFSSTTPAPSPFSSAPAQSSSGSPSPAFPFSASGPAPGGPPPPPSLFGNVPSTFGASDTPAPAPGVFGFTSPSGTTPTTPKKKSTSANRRLNRR